MVKRKFILNSKKNKRAQVWVETVLYTLIGLAIIGLLLAATKPKIDSTKDEFVIQQTIKALNQIDDKISEIKAADGNQRNIDFQISRGELKITPETSTISWILKDSAYRMSEENLIVEVAGNIKGVTLKNGDNYDIKLFLNYTGINILKQDNGDNELTLNPARIPYRIMVRNTGELQTVETKQLLVIDVDVS
jgi:type II secretory pathway pseudopilin PulG